LFEIVLLNYCKACWCAPKVCVFRYAFICQDTSTRRQWSDLFDLQVKLPPATTSLTTQR